MQKSYPVEVEEHAAVDLVDDDELNRKERDQGSLEGHEAKIYQEETYEAAGVIFS